MKVVPFTFDAAFDGGASKNAAKAEAQFREELTMARTAAHAQGFEEGYSQGYQQAKQELETAILANLQALAAQIGGVASELPKLKQKLIADSAALVLPMAEAIAGLEIQKRPYESLERHVRHVLEEHTDEARLVIRVADGMLDAVKARVESMADAYGFQGRLIFLAEPTLMPGDAIIEWPDGGVEVRQQTRLDEVREKTESFVASLATRPVSDLTSGSMDGAAAHPDGGFASDPMDGFKGIA